MTTPSSRRRFLSLLGASGAAGALPPGIARALEIPAHHRTGTIDDVEHVVILMQENRSFDHYFGTLRGVRGFNDPRVLRHPSGKPIWYQANGTSDEVLPFRPPVDNLGLTFLPDPPHGWTDTHAAVNHGRMDQFVANKGLSALTYHLRSDIPYHFALAEAFTVCDAYHCSLQGPTDPNRYHLWSGWVGNNGKGGGPVITNAEAGYDWTTYPERLERAGISWKVYQDVGDGLDADDGHWWGWTADPYIVNYDEEGGFFDHMSPPVPPQSPAHGDSTVSTRHEIYAGDSTHPAGPYGLGLRVPMIVASPWSKGGWVNSQLFDHTSVIRFLEARFARGNPDLIERNITPWRRAVVGDLTSCFDFAQPQVRKPALPSTAAYLPPDLERHPDYEVVAPGVDVMPRQEPGVARARALPYALQARGELLSGDGSYQIEMRNIGQATAVFQVHSALAADLPRHYTVEPGKHLVGVWPVAAQGASAYELSVRGPNGFLREFRGRLNGVGRQRLSVQESYDPGRLAIELLVRNVSSHAAEVRVFDAYSGGSVSLRLEGSATQRLTWSLSRSQGWYALHVTVAQEAGYEVVLAGHLENGQPSITDPMMGRLRLKG